MSPFSTRPSLIRPKFTDIARELYPDRRNNENGKPVFADFSPKGREVTLHFCLLSYNNCCDIPDDSSMKTYFDALASSLSVLKVSNNMGKEELDLIDAASAFFAELIRSSKYIRKVLVEKETEFSFASILETICRLQSVFGQSYLASGIYYLLIDFELWTSQSSPDEWRKNVNFDGVLEHCLSNFNIEGAIFVAAYYSKAFRTFHQVSSSSCETSWILCLRVLSAFGDGLLHTEDSVAIACTTSLGIALFSADIASQVNKNSIHMHEKFNGTDPFTLSGISALAKLTEGFSKAANTSKRLYALVRAVGSILDGISPIYVETERPLINSLFDLLSSRIVHQDSQLALVVRECLYFSTASIVVLQRLIDVEFKTTVNQTRNSVSLCLLGFLTITLKLVSFSQKKFINNGIALNS